ncbi:MAG: glycoside hydrolase family 99-like domain-containing protein [Thermoflexales bacterium]
MVSVHHLLRICTTAVCAISIILTPRPTPLHAQPTTPRVVIADYMMWYEPSLFDGTQTFDTPLAGPYRSGDDATIQRHVAQAQQACLDGFAPHWYGPFEPITTQNFAKLLRYSEGTSLRHAIVLQTNVLPQISESVLTEALRFLIEQWTPHPNYLKIEGRPVILFTDMPRPWGSPSAALRGWKRVRDATDPQRRTIWMAEGYTTAFNPLFDGLYIYRIDHKNTPRAWLRQPFWAKRLRQVAAKHQTRLFFADTIAPGYDDTRSRRVPVDHRVPSPSFARDRRNGEYYRETFEVTRQTNGDFLVVKSFNEWVEGTSIEPGTTYGDRYLQLTCELANLYRQATPSNTEQARFNSQP